jgi:hypothetical protein
MRPVSLGIGVLIAFLISFAALLFGLPFLDMIALFLVLIGFWLLTYGAFIARRDEAYISAWGVVLILLSTFRIGWPIQYTIGLVIVGIIGAVFYSYLVSPSRKAKTKTP